MLSLCQELLCTEPHSTGTTYMENSCKEAVHSRDPVTYRPTLDQQRGRNVGRNSQGGVLREEYSRMYTQGGALKKEHSKMNTQGSTWKRRTLGGTPRGKHLSRNTQGEALKEEHSGRTTHGGALREEHPGRSTRGQVLQGSQAPEP